mgnify:FL=1
MLSSLADGNPFQSAFFKSSQQYGALLFRRDFCGNLHGDIEHAYLLGIQKKLDRQGVVQAFPFLGWNFKNASLGFYACLLYTSDAADE